ncbi:MULTISPECIES: response regulator [Paenibacillus]|uniref:DNA-binding response regulator n=1 Tax=Paenibacillus campinasensis TaxID=66347 RepID=A0A268F1I4_9BACL|nr:MULTISPECIES: response regulator transcription factor [Paenibacillus]PAD79246.1 DNA-binding response regulator [Paenibacillus campinasensis]PAK54240.1 DNA-binding response regulator [Paenibacillus sp. 7541]
MKHKILIVDDHWVVREGLKMILETDEQYEVIGEAEEGESAIGLIKEAEPDIILLDLNMPGGLDGLGTLEKMKELQLEIPVIILTTYNEDELMMNALALGAKGYLLKDTSRDNLFRTLQSALRGETLLQPEITSRVFAFRQDRKSSLVPESSYQVTPKERIILQAIARGARNKEIASDLGISERTVKAHLTNIYNKLGVDSRSEAVAVSIEKGILQL